MSHYFTDMRQNWADDDLGVIVDRSSGYRMYCTSNDGSEDSMIQNKRYPPCIITLESHSVVNGHCNISLST